MKKTAFLLILPILLLLAAAVIPAFAATPPQTEPKIQLLVASWCVRCKDMEDLLKELKVNYERLDVEKDPAGKELYSQLGGGGVPILIAGKSLIRGFDRAVVVEMIKKVKP